MNETLYNEMLSTDCWNGPIVFSAKGFRYEVLPNPVFGLYPTDCDRKPAGIFFTAQTVSLLVQSSPDDANIEVEDSLDVISSIVEHEIALNSRQDSPTTKVLEFRCLHNRFWFGNIEVEETVFDALPSVLSVYSPGISYEKFQPMNLGIETLQNTVAYGEFSGWTPPPPSEARKSTTGKRTKSTSNNSSSSSSDSDSDSSSSSSSEWSYSNVASSSKKRRSARKDADGGDDESDSPVGAAAASSASRKHRYFGGTMLFNGNASNNSGSYENNQSFDFETQSYAVRNFLQCQEAEGRFRLINEEYVPELTSIVASGFVEFRKLLFTQLDAVHQVNLTTLNSRQTVVNNAAEGIPQSYALEEPASEIVSDFINELEKSVRVRMKTYLINGSGQQALSQRQQAEAQTMYRSLSEQLERLKSQNSQLAIQLAQERRSIDEVETELDTTKAELSKAKAREQAVLSRMRKREADWAASGGRGGPGGESALVVDTNHHHHEM